MRRTIRLTVITILACMMMACQQKEGKGSSEPPVDVMEDGIIAFPSENAPSTTNEDMPGSEKEHIEKIAEENGFTPLYVTFGNKNTRHAYLFVEMDDAWSEEKKEQHVEKTRAQFEQELPQLQVTLQVVNDGKRN